MQTFLPYPSYYRSLNCLDPTRLGNQCYREGKTLVNGGWSNHPIAKMWKGYEYSLCLYCLEGFAVLSSRGKLYREQIDWFINKANEFKNIKNPPWLGNEDLHASHRSNLLFKGRVDALYKSLKKYDNFNNLNLKKSDINRDTIEELERFCLKNNIEIGENYYKKFGWKEPDNLPYVWILD